MVILSTAILLAYSPAFAPPIPSLTAKAKSVIAVDASVGPLQAGSVPDPWEALFATISIIGHGIVSQKLSAGGPDLLLRPNPGPVRMFDFFRASAILRTAEPIKAELAARLGALLDR